MGELRRRGRTWIPVAGVLAGAGWGSNQFTPMLLVYHARLGLSTATLEGLFGAYAVGLIPGLLVTGWWSDAHGRRPVGVSAAVLSLLASVSLVAGAHAVALLFAGRLLAGLGSGAAFGVGTVWLRENSLAPFGDADHATVARRAAVAMTIGFALGPLVAGLLAQWAPDPTVVPYLPHIVLMVVVLVILRAVPETLAASGRGATRTRLSAASIRRFRRLVVPMAPWVFAAPAIAFALLPSVVGAGHAADGVAITAAVTSLTALSGVLIQPVARRLEAGARDQAGSMLGLLVLATGLALGALAAAVHETWLLVPCSLVLGSAYGLCLVAGLVEVQRLGPERALGALTAAYYALTYIGFAAPYLMTLASGAASYAVLLLIASGLAVLTAGVVRQGAKEVGERRGQPVGARLGNP
ncbi:MAG TPA: MFS transporter [Solirubrobacteraceae bacterium]|nr:MFS transporter [Solirubrobacteraceae bacterium]